MEAVGQYMRHGWIWALSLFIFFFNTFPLPGGLTYTMLLTPVWFYLLYRQRKLPVLMALCLPLAFYAVIHIANGVSLTDYIVSSAIIISLFIFLVPAQAYFASPAVNWDLIFRDIVVLNFLLAMLSLPLLFIPLLKPLVWYLVPISPGIPDVPRLKLFTSEASHYSFLLAPVAIYFYSRLLFFRAKNIWPTLVMVSIPLIMSFSMGVLLSIGLTGGLMILFYFRKIFASRKRRIIIIGAVSLLMLLLVAAWFLFPDNPLFERVRNILSGKDTSARGRTYEAFILAHKIVATKSYLWGIGPGQLKIIGRDIIVQFYFYTKIPDTIRIPNAAAETIAYFGYVGFAIRILAEVFLFIKTKVYRNPYRLWLFMFVFLFQFTGSYITNVAEYLLWLLVFSNIFPEFSYRERSLSPLKPLSA